MPKMSSGRSTVPFLPPVAVVTSTVLIRLRPPALHHGGRRAVLLVVAVRRALPAEVVALHHTCEALALADAGDVDALAGAEHVRAKQLTDLEAADVVDPQLREVLRRRHCRAVEVAELGLVQAARLRLTERELHRAVA